MSHSEKMRFTFLTAIVTMIAMSAGCTPAAVEEAVEPTTVNATGVEPVNDLPNPYERIEPWTELPDGQPWAAVTGAEPGPDGNLYIFHRCFENSCAGRPEPAIVKLDMSGNFLTSWVGYRQHCRHRSAVGRNLGRSLHRSYRRNRYPCCRIFLRWEYMAHPVTMVGRQK